MREKKDLEKLLSEGKTVQVSPIGYSMYPLIVPGRDMVRIRRTDVSRLRRGDVVLYRRSGSILVIHRILKKRRDQLFLAGDNQSEVEGPLSVKQVRGKMIGFERKGKYVSVKSPLYRFFSRLWLWLFPVRPLMFKVARKLDKGIRF